jgi:hypothetical protein
METWLLEAEMARRYIDGALVLTTTFMTAATSPRPVAEPLAEAGDPVRMASSKPALNLSLMLAAFPCERGRPLRGTELTVDLAGMTLELRVVGDGASLRAGALSRELTGACWACL